MGIDHDPRWNPEPLDAKESKACLILAMEHLAAWFDHMSISPLELSFHETTLADGRPIMAMYAVGQGVPTMRNVLRVLQAKGVIALDPRYTDG